ncbi:MAG: cofactor-independent phosphoglycerate mutase [Bacillota bacterium]
MKYIVILGDGMPDYPLEALGGKTPLQYARTPHMDWLAQRGELGMVKSVPPNLPPGSDVANLSIMGYDPARYYTGRAPIEAVAMGVDLAAGDTAFRCNLVTLSAEKNYAEKTMLDYSAGEIDTGEARLLVDELSRRFADGVMQFHAGMSYRHLMVWREGPDNFTLTPPHDIHGQIIGPYLPGDSHGEKLLTLMRESHAFLPHHPVNRERAARGLNVANSIWLWGQGRKPRLDSFPDKYGLNGAVISAVDLIKGLGLCAGLEAVYLPGATGNIHTDFRGKARKALEKLQEGLDFVFVHVEAPDEAGHQGDLQTKIKAIEEIDEKVVGEVLAGLRDFPESRLMVLSDHPTPLSLRTHTREAVPYCIYKGDKIPGNPASAFCEEAAGKGPCFDQGHLLMDYFIWERF